MQTVKKEYVVCCDNMGQDRGIDDKQKAWLANMVQLFSDSWS